MNRVIHFELSMDNPERAIKFYSDVFGWDSQKWDGPMEYRMITTGPDNQPGICGGLSKREEDDRVVHTIEVEYLDAVVDQNKRNGGTVVMGKSPIPQRRVVCPLRRSREQSSGSDAARSKRSIIQVARLAWVDRFAGSPRRVSIRPES